MTFFGSAHWRYRVDATNGTGQVVVRTYCGTEAVRDEALREAASRGLRAIVLAL